MSAHPIAMLSAYLDGELGPQDRAGVEQHLRQCGSCGQHLEELAAVDALARSVPVAAPAGYFQDLPGRVVGRLPPRAARVRTVPTWTWALAAGLVVGVAAPLVVVQMQHRAAAPMGSTADAPVHMPAAPALHEAAATPPPVASPAATTAQAPARQKLAGAPAGGAAPAPAEVRDRLGNLGYVAPPPAEESARDERDERPRQRDLAGDKADTPASSGVPQGFSRRPAPPATPPVTLSGAASRVPPAQAEPTPLPPPPAAAAPGMVALASPPAAVDEAIRPGRDGEAEQARARPHVREALEPAKKAEAERKEARQRADTNRGGMAIGGRRMAGPSEVQFEALSARVVTSVAEARALREAWRNYARQHPGESTADEARVRLVEAGADAYRRGQDPADLAVVRQDARAYLQSADALQAQRVRKVLEGLPPQP
jgi:hypothetical protein